MYTGRIFPRWAVIAVSLLALGCEADVGERSGGDRTEVAADTGVVVEEDGERAREGDGAVEGDAAPGWEGTAPEEQMPVAQGHVPAEDLLASFAPGTPRDSVMGALPDGGALADERIGESQLLHGYVLEQYLIQPGRVDVLWVHEPDVGLPEVEVQLRSRLNPVVFRDGLLDGSGWAHYELRMDEWGLPEQWSVPMDRDEGGTGIVEPGTPDGGDTGGERGWPEERSPEPEEAPTSVPNNPTNRA